MVNYLKCVFKKKSVLLLGLEEWERHIPYMHDFCYILLFDDAEEIEQKTTPP